jgi:hypothetical protein
MCHLDICNTSYDKKKGRESNWQFDSRPLKVGNRPDFVAFRRLATYRWKVLDKGYNFASDLIAIGVVHKKLCALKVARVPVVGILGLSLGSPGTKSPFGCGPCGELQSILYGEGGGFPRVWAVMSLVSPELLVACPSTKGAPKSGLTNWAVGAMQVQVSN